MGEERGSRRIARALVAARQEEPITTTSRLKKIVEGLLPRGVKVQPVLSRIFQALRIAVNEELTALDEALAALPAALRPGGRFVVISYHSLEDRRVKRFIDREKRDCLCPTDLPGCVCGHRKTLKPLTRKAVIADAQEHSKHLAGHPGPGGETRAGCDVYSGAREVAAAGGSDGALRTWRTARA